MTEGAFDDPDWLYEIKWDGYRVEAVVRPKGVSLWTRNRIDAATYFPDLAGPADWITAREAVVDGEVVAFDPDSAKATARWSCSDAASAGARGGRAVCRHAG